MPRVTYKGPMGATFLSYVDLATGQALVAEPGGTYDIRAVNGPDVPGNFVLAEEEDNEEKSFPVEGEAFDSAPEVEE
jgi:hypothetical protein